MHVLHRAGPRPLQHAAPVAEVLPGQRVGAERRGRGVVPAARHGQPPATPCDRRMAVPRSAGKPQKYLESRVSFPITSDEISDYARCHIRVRRDVPSGQRRGRWSGVPLEDRQALRRDELIAAGVALLGGAAGPGAHGARRLPGGRADRTLLLRELRRPRRIRPRSLRRRLHPGDVGTRDRDNAPRRRRTVRRDDGRRSGPRPGTAARARKPNRC